MSYLSSEDYHREQTKKQSNHHPVKQIYKYTYKHEINETSQSDLYIYIYIYIYVYHYTYVPSIYLFSDQMISIIFIIDENSRLGWMDQWVSQFALCVRVWRLPDQVSENLFHIVKLQYKLQGDSKMRYMHRTVGKNKFLLKSLFFVLYRVGARCPLHFCEISLHTSVAVTIQLRSSRSRVRWEAVSSFQSNILRRIFEFMIDDKRDDHLFKSMSCHSDSKKLAGLLPICFLTGRRRWHDWRWASCNVLFLLK